MNSPTKWGFTEYFCTGVVLLCFGYFFWVTALTMHGEDVGTEISEIKICIIGIAGSVVGFVIGSTKSSKDKDKLISEALNSTPANATPPNTKEDTIKVTQTTTDTTQP